MAVASVPAMSWLTRRSIRGLMTALVTMKDSPQANVKHYNRQLRDLIHEGRAKPSWVVSHELPLDEAPSGYQHFDARDDGWTKVVLHP